MIAGASSSDAASAASRNRFRGSFSKHLVSSQRTCAGVSIGKSYRSGSLVTTAAMTSVTVSPANGCRPVSIS